MSAPASSIPKGSWVLVTGATGFVAGHVIRQFLQCGYKVRGTVRDIEKASWFIDDHFKSYAESGDLELVEVPDMAVDGAFDEAVKGVSAVAHLAASTDFDPNPNNSVPLAVAGVRSILTSAAGEKSVKEFVFTSSIAAVASLLSTNDICIDRNTWNDAAVEAAWAPPPYELSRGMVVYSASKYAAEKEVWKFVEGNKPNFTTNVICPFGIIGEPLNEKHTDGAGNIIAAFFRGDRTQLDTFPTAYFSDVEDIATLHVACVLDPEVKNARLHAWGQKTHWNDFLAILRRLRSQKEWISDYPNPKYLKMSTDQSDSLQLLKKWAGKDGWKSLEQSLIESVNNAYCKHE